MNNWQAIGGFHEPIPSCKQIWRMLELTVKAQFGPEFFNDRVMQSIHD